MDILFGVLGEGLLYAIMALGVYITYKILDFPDLSVDGTFPLGGAVSAILIVNGVNPIVTLFISLFMGALAGMLTGIIHVKFKVRDLLSGIIMMTALYSINLRIAGKANLPFFSKGSIFDNEWVNSLIPSSVTEYGADIITILVLLIIVLIVKLSLDAYLRTRSGYLLRAVGDNETLVTSLAKDKGMVKIIGLAIANAFAALAGSVFCQLNGYFDISMGTGTMVVGLANVIIGTNLYRLLKQFRFFKWLRPTTAVIIGAIVYKGCVSIAMNLGLATSDNKLIVSIIFLIILVTSNAGKRRVKSNA